MLNVLYKYLLFIIMLFVFAFSSCNNSNTIETLTDAGETALSELAVNTENYTIVRSDFADDTEVKAAVRLRNALSDIYGYNFAIETDWEKKDKTTSSSQNSKNSMRLEILVGNTSRPESAEKSSGLRYDDYIIDRSGESIIINGGSPEAIAEAVEYFIFCCNEAPPLNSVESYTYNRAYAIPDPKIGGVSLDKYIISVTLSDSWNERKTAERIQTYFLEKSGIKLEIAYEANKEKDYEILLGSSLREDALSLRNTLETDGYAYGLYGNKLIITGNNILGFKYGYSVFEGEYMKNNNVDINENDKKNGAAKYISYTLYADAENGSDTGDGSELSPLKTISAVMNSAMLLGETSPCNITVFLSGGEYILSEPIRLNDELFSGMPGGISFKAKGGIPVLSAAQPVDGFKETIYNGVSAWAAPLPVIKDGNGNEKILVPHQAFHSSGERLARPRLPAEGFYYVADVPGYAEPFNTEYRVSMSEMNFNKGEISNISNLSDIQIRMFHYWDDERIEISEIDYERSYIKFGNPSSFALKQESSTTRGAPYFLDNVPEAFDSPGEFYADRVTGMLYYIPREGELIDDTVIYVSSLTEIMTIDGLVGSENHPSVEFDGISFSGSDWFVTARSPSQAASDITAAITINDSSYITFTGCSFAHTGTTAVKVTEGVHNLTFSHCDFYDLGGGGIHIAGTNDVPATEKTLHDINVTDCRIDGYGRVYANAVGILLRYAYDCNLSHNEISDGFYTGISVGWVWGYGAHVTDNIKVEYNHIYNIGQRLLSDMGGIYTLGIQPNTVLRNNLIHDIQMACYGGWGIYPDEGSSGILIENNICYNMSAQPFHQHYGEDNIVRNNIFAFGDGGQFIITRKEEHNSLILECNILLSDGTAVYAKHPNDMNMTDSGNLIWDYSGEAVSGYMDYDVTRRLYSFPSKNKLNFNDMQKFGLYKGTVIADPLFADPKNGDFTPAEDSPIFDMGFKPIDMSTTGVRN